MCVYYKILCTNIYISTKNVATTKFIICSITYSESVFVAFLKYAILCAILVSVVCPALRYFFHIIA
jgi:hypothetical protein